MEQLSRNTDVEMPSPSTDSEDGRNGSSSSGNGKRKSIAEVGRTIPASYLAVGKDTIPYDLRVQQLERGGLPDVLVETAEAQPPGHFGEESPLRSEMDALLAGAAQRLRAQENGGTSAHH
jgi:hypothetical protein